VFRFIDGRLCNSVAAGFGGIELADGGRIEELLLAIMVPPKLGGLPYREVGLAAVDLTVGSRLGDLLVRPCDAAGLVAAVFSFVSEATDLSNLAPFSEGLRSDRVREGIADMS
jgi:hypothetical protein